MWLWAWRAWSGAAHSPNVSRLVEALMLELCRARNDEGATIAGVRVQRWAGVIKDYKLIRENVLGCRTLMANTRIALYEVNQRTLSFWHNQHLKAMAMETVRTGAAPPSAPQTSENLPAAQSLLPEAVQPDQPMQHNLPADESGLAVTRRGPLAPELYERSIKRARTSSSSVDTRSSTQGPSTTSPSSSAASPSTSSAKTVSPTVASQRHV
ncbi:uncharacterized protein ACB058_011494 [Synchiropus picturatus]